MQTEAIVAACAAELGVPRMIFVNKLDRERASFERTLDQLRDRVRRRRRARSSCPSARRPTFRGVADLLTDTAYRLRAAARRTTARSPTSMDGARAPGARQPRRGHRRRRRRRCWSATSRATIPSFEELEHTLAHGVADGHGVPGRVRLGHHGRRPSTGWPTSSARSARRPPTARRVDGDGRRHRRSRSRPTRPASRSPSCSRPSPTRTSASSRCSRCCRARSGPTTTSSTPARGTDERLHGLFTLRGKEQDAGRRGARRRHRRRGQARRHRHRRHAGAEGHAGRGRRRSQPPPPVLVDRRSWPAPRPTTTSSATALHRLQDEDPALRRRAQRRDPPDAAARHGRDPPRRSRSSGSRRKFGVDVDTEDVRVPYRETITRHGRGRGQVQEADRRPRPVRRGLPPRRAARARRGLRVRRQDRRRRHPPPVHPRGAEGHRGGDGARRRATAIPVVDVRVDAASTASTTPSTRRR